MLNKSVQVKRSMRQSQTKPPGSATGDVHGRDRPNTAPPAKRALPPSASSIRNISFHFAIRSPRCIRASQVVIQRMPGRSGGGMGGGHGHRQQRIGAKSAFVSRSIQFHQPLIERFLIRRVQTDDRACRGGETAVFPLIRSPLWVPSIKSPMVPLHRATQH